MFEQAVMATKLDGVDLTKRRNKDRLGESYESIFNIPDVNVFFLITWSTRKGLI